MFHTHPLGYFGGALAKYTFNVTSMAGKTITVQTPTASTAYTVGQLVRNPAAGYFEGSAINSEDSTVWQNLQSMVFTHSQTTTPSYDPMPMELINWRNDLLTTFSYSAQGGGGVLYVAPMLNLTSISHSSNGVIASTALRFTEISIPYAPRLTELTLVASTLMSTVPRLDLSNSPVIDSLRVTSQGLQHVVLPKNGVLKTLDLGRNMLGRIDNLPKDTIVSFKTPYQTNGSGTIVPDLLGRYGGSNIAVGFSTKLSLGTDTPGVLDLSDTPALDEIDARGSGLTQLNITNATQLRSVTVSNNVITTVPGLGTCGNLQIFVSSETPVPNGSPTAPYNNLGVFDMSSNPTLSQVRIDSSGITRLLMPPQNTLVTLIAFGNAMRTIDGSGTTGLNRVPDSVKYLMLGMGSAERGQLMPTPTTTAYSTTYPGLGTIDLSDLTAPVQVMLNYCGLSTVTWPAFNSAAYNGIKVIFLQRNKMAMYPPVPTSCEIYTNYQQMTNGMTATTLPNASFVTPNAQSLLDLLASLPLATNLRRLMLSETSNSLVGTRFANGTVMNLAPCTKLNYINLSDCNLSGISLPPTMGGGASTTNVENPWYQYAVGPGIIQLVIPNNKLTSLSLAGQTGVTSLVAYNNQIDTLTLPATTSFTNFQMGNTNAGTTSYSTSQVNTVPQLYDLHTNNSPVEITVNGCNLAPVGLVLPSILGTGQNVGFANMYGKLVSMLNVSSNKNLTTIRNLWGTTETGSTGVAPTATNARAQPLAWATGSGLYGSSTKLGQGVHMPSSVTEGFDPANQANSRVFPVGWLSGSTTYILTATYVPAPWRTTQISSPATINTPTGTLPLGITMLPTVLSLINVGLTQGALTAMLTLMWSFRRRWVSPGASPASVTLSTASLQARLNGSKSADFTTSNTMLSTTPGTVANATFGDVLVRDYNANPTPAGWAANAAWYFMDPNNRLPISSSVFKLDATGRMLDGRSIHEIDDVTLDSDGRTELDLLTETWPLREKVWLLCNLQYWNAATQTKTGGARYNWSIYVNK